MLAPDLIIVEAFVPNCEKLFAALTGGIAWDERMRARKTASFGASYNYSGIEYAAVPMHELLVPLVEQLESRLKFRPNNCPLNFHESGDATMGFHSDATDELAPGTGVAIVSLGAQRNITFQSKPDKAIERSYLLESGLLLYMSAEVQDKWKHAILKQESVGGRISLTFRQMERKAP